MANTQVNDVYESDLDTLRGRFVTDATVGMAKSGDYVVIDLYSSSLLAMDSLPRHCHVGRFFLTSQGAKQIAENLLKPTPPNAEGT